ncbi:hypothetical protein ADU76_04210 (plasmid) [Clostridium botulinum]|uniref:Kiwa anti-phage protein KwaB-like domain-containing protein n=1 Tax=Clostridium botulinum TaxID=1491 RepID=UPI00069B5454|nr:Kiwa anti-phage protein KwaB-like domain-containing protein [Clostridium botulinum]KOA94021.1 hypothetical protein ADU76_04210 [Clostridium botulinum]
MCNNVIKSSLDNFFNCFNNKFQVYYITKESDKSKQVIYDSFYCNMGKELKESLIEGYKKSLNKYGNYMISDYDVVIHEDDCIEKINSNDIKNMSIFKKLSNNINSKKASEIDVDINKIWGYAIVLKNDRNEKLIAFRKYSVSKNINENKKLSFVNGNVEEYKQDIFSLDLKIDVIEINGVAYITNRYYFETMFGFKEEYRKYVNNSLSQLKQEDVIENFDDFSDRCLDSGNLVKKLVYVVKNDRLHWLKDNMISAQQVINEYNLKVKIENNKIQYSKKDCRITDVMKLICGCCVKDAVDRERYFASSVKKIS